MLCARPCCRASAVLALLLAAGAQLAAAEYNRSDTSAPPVAYTTSGEFKYVLFANTSAANAAQVWPAAQAACQGLGGNLTSVGSESEEFIVIQLHQMLNGTVTGLPFGNTTLCTWLGYSNVFATSGSNIDGSAATYIATKVSFGSGTANATYYNSNVGCAAVCEKAYYLRDCDYEAQSFVCRVPASAVLPGSPLNVTAPAATTPTPAYGSSVPTYGNSIGTTSTSPSAAIYPPTYPYAGLPTEWTCSAYAGYTYCYSTATKYSWSDAQHACVAGGKGALASLSSISELTFALSRVPLNSSSAPAFWTGAVRPGFDATVNIGQTAANSSWVEGLPSTTLVAPAPEFPSAANFSFLGLGASFAGMCLAGNGCGVALTYNALSATIGGLQYVDTGYHAGVLCKAVTPASSGTTTNVTVDVPAVPDPADVPTTPRNPNDPVATLKVQAVLAMSAIGCSVILQQPQSFQYQWRNTTANAWTEATGGTITILPGDIAIDSYESTCTSRRLRALLQSGSATIGATMTMPPNVNAAQANAYQTAFETAAAAAYTSGSFSSTFGVTGASVTAARAEDASGSSSDALAIGLGVGLGVGIPVVVALIALVAFIVIRRRKQRIGNAGGAGSGPAPADGPDDEGAREPLQPDNQA